MKTKDLEIIIGFICNNNCIFCSNKYLRNSCIERDIPNISFEEIKKILESNNAEEVGTLIFVGGEPTIHKDFFKIIRLAKKLGYNNIAIQTNGRMLKNINFVKKLYEYNIDVGISIHGDSASLHDKLTRTPGSFEQLVSGMNNIKTLGKTFTTNATINKLNYKRIPNIIKFLSRYNPSSILFSLVSPMGNPRNNLKNILPNLKDMPPIIEESVLVAKKLNQNIRFMDIPFCIMNKYENYMQEKEFKIDRQVVVKGMEDIFYLDNKNKKEKEKPAECASCVKKNTCSGLWEEYIELYQDNGLERINSERIKLWDGALDDALINAISSNMKPCARLENIKIKSVDKVINKIKKAGLKYRIFSRQFRLDRINMKFSFSKHKDENSYVSLFISKNENLLDTIMEETHKEIEDKNSEYKKQATQRIGKLLGYPECCTKAFSDIDNYIDDKTENIRAKKRTDGKLSWLLNNLVNPYTLIDFYPCSYNCENAIDYAKNMLDLVSKSNYDKKKLIKYYLHSIILYFNFNNYIVFDGLLIDDKTIKYSSFKSSRNLGKEFMRIKDNEFTRLTELLKIGDRVFLDSTNTINNIKIFKNLELVGKVECENELLGNGIIFNFKDEE